MSDRREERRAMNNTAAGATGGRERLLAAADSLFRQRGFADVSMQQIAEAAGVTKAAPYYHFKDKEELLAEVFVRVMERHRAGVLDRFAGDDPFPSRLERVVEFLLTVGAADMARIAGDAGKYIGVERLAALRSRVIPPQETLAVAFASCSDHLSGTSPEAAARLFVALVLGHVELAAMGRLLPRVTDAPAVDPADLVRAFRYGLAGLAPA
jgi:AcrR family transcriptional regulator